MSDVSVTVGDVIHFVETDAPSDIGATVEAPAPIISDLLAQSREAHRQFRESDGAINKDGTLKTAPNYDTALQAIQAALNPRLLAENQDPIHSDPAWAEDLAANRGVSSKALIDFYRDYVA